MAIGDGLAAIVFLAYAGLAAIPIATVALAYGVYRMVTTYTIVRR
jgi:hypothetical protein